MGTSFAACGRPSGRQAAGTICAFASARLCVRAGRWGGHRGYRVFPVGAGQQSGL